jgi:hypothetical protein
MMSKFKNMFFDEGFPIICGHGLDNDFKCMEVQPPFVIDTAGLFSKGNFKLKLKYLAEILLEKEI